MAEIMEKLCARSEITNARVRGTKRREIGLNDERESDGAMKKGDPEKGGREGGPFSGRAGPIRLYCLIMQIV